MAWLAKQSRKIRAGIHATWLPCGQLGAMAGVVSRHVPPHESHNAKYGCHPEMSGLVKLFSFESASRSLQHRLQWEDHESRMQTKLVEHSQAQAEVASYQARENTRLQAGYDQDVLRASEQDHIRSNEASNQNMLRARSARP